MITIINIINIEFPEKGSSRWTRWTRKTGPTADEGHPQWAPAVERSAEPAVSASWPLGTSSGLAPPPRARRRTEAANCY